MSEQEIDAIIGEFLPRLFKEREEVVGEIGNVATGEIINLDIE